MQAHRHTCTFLLMHACQSASTRYMCTSASHRASTSLLGVHTHPCRRMSDFSDCSDFYVSIVNYGPWTMNNIPLLFQNGAKFN